MVASDVHYAGAGLHTELSLLQDPLAVVVHEGEVAGLDGQGYCFGLTGFEFYFFKRAQSAIVRSQRCYYISAEKHNDFLTGAITCIGDVDCENEIIVDTEFRM